MPGFAVWPRICSIIHGTSGLEILVKVVRHQHRQVKAIHASTNHVT